MSEAYTNKVVLSSGETLIDLTSDTVTADTMLTGATAHDASGAPITGSCTYDADTSDATALDAEVLLNKTFYKAGSKHTGTMPNIGTHSGVISTRDGSAVIPRGYHDGSGSVVIDTNETAKIIGNNIKSGVVILGITGTYSGESISAQAKTATPTFTQQTILPDASYDYLTQVTISAIPVTRVLNASGGYTVTIG